MSTAACFRLSVDAERIAWLTFDKPGASANALSSEVLDELDRQLAVVERVAPRGLVILSAKENGFVAGADVKEFTTLASVAEAEALERCAASAGRKVRVHVKVDTGMGRAGVWHTEARGLIDFVRAAKHLDWRGLFTHFSEADADTDFTAEQRRIFLALLAEVPADERARLLVHADNSAGLETFSAASPFNAVRIGLMQYGLPPSAGSFLASLRPESVLSFHARVVLVKDLPAGTAVSYNRTKVLTRASRVAIVAVGYGDGVPTAASNRGSFLLRGHRCPILGRVTMDQTIVDVTDVPGVAVGDVATILGAQGADRITVREFCAWADCIPWEALCTLTQRVQRVYRTDRT